MHELLLAVKKKGNLTHGVKSELAKKKKKNDVHRKTISRIWAHVKQYTTTTRGL